MREAARSLRRRGKSIGFVPTMGALHEGHLSLVRAARCENDAVVVSIFVNPLQFGPREDFKRYPRTLDADTKMLRAAKADLLFLPAAQDILPTGELTAVEPPRALVDKLCGRFRPGHFRGVATIVAKLFNLVKPARAYFGQKDYQQCAVVRRLARDLDFDLEVKMLPIVRERDGLAMSSRNRYLSTAERRRAEAVSAILFDLRKKAAETADWDALKKRMRRELARAVDRVDYLEIVHPETLEPVSRPAPRAVALAACWVGKTRLIDNVIIAPRNR